MMEGIRSWQGAWSVEDGEEDDARLVARAVGDPEAFALLYRRYVGRVFQYLRAHTAAEEEAADLTQLVFVRVFERLPAFRPRHEASFAAWLFRIAHNAAIDAARRRKRTLSWSSPLPDDLASAAGPGPEMLTLRRDLLLRLDVLIARLSPEKQELLALRFAGELSIPEIAAALGKSEAAVRKQLTRTVHVLKEQLDADER